MKEAWSTVHNAGCKITAGSRPWNENKRCYRRYDADLWEDDTDWVSVIAQTFVCMQFYTSTQLTSSNADRKDTPSSQTAEMSRSSSSSSSVDRTSSDDEDHMATGRRRRTVSERSGGGTSTKSDERSTRKTRRSSQAQDDDKSTKQRTSKTKNEDRRRKTDNSPQHERGGNYLHHHICLWSASSELLYENVSVCSTTSRSIRKTCSTKTVKRLKPTYVFVFCAIILLL